MAGVFPTTPQRAGFAVRPMKRNEMDLARAWAEAQGWNPGVDDGSSFYAVDPEGFLVEVFDRMPIACVAAVAHHDDFGFIGMHLVAPSYQGSGCGHALLMAARHRLGARSVGLEGIIARQDEYERLGFTAAHRNTRFEGVGRELARFHNPQLDKVVDARRLPFRDVVAYDARFFPVARPEFLKPWLDQPHAVCLGVMESWGLTGFGAIRRCAEGYRIGPLFADGPAEAETLYEALAAHALGEPLFLDVPAGNPHARELVERHNLRPILETVRMYAGAVPHVPLANVYGITTLELG